MAPTGLGLHGPSGPSSDLLLGWAPLSTRSAIVKRTASHMSSGAKAGISLGCIFGVAILFCIAWPFIIRWRSSSTTQTWIPANDDPSHNKDKDQRSTGDPPFDPTPVGDSPHDLDSDFDWSLPVPPHYRDHPGYLAHLARQSAAQNGEQNTSRLGQLNRQFKDNAKKNFAWSASKALMITNAFDISISGRPVVPNPDPGLPSPPLEAAPMHLWNPTNQSERQHKMIHDLGLLESNRDVTRGGSSAASQVKSPAATFVAVSLAAFPSAARGNNGPPAASDWTTPNDASQDAQSVALPSQAHIPEIKSNMELGMVLEQPTGSSPPPTEHVPEVSSLPLSPPPDIKLEVPSSPPQSDSDTPPPHPIFTPQSHDVEMQDVSDISTPHEIFSSHHDTPDTRFTDSEFNPTSPKSNGDHSELDFASPPAAEYASVAADPSDAVSPGAASSVASPTSFTCDECGKLFEQIHRLNHHKRYHERKHECTVEGCNKKFGTKTHLDRHINDKHKKTRKFYCTEPSCPYSIQGGKSFPRKDNWVRHIRKKHRNLSVSSQTEAQGFLIDEETGTTQSVAAPPSQKDLAQQQQQQQRQHPMTMGYGIPLDIPMAMGQGMGGAMAPGMNGGINGGMSAEMTRRSMYGNMNGMDGMGMGNMDGLHHMNILQQPPMPPGAGFNSSWNMGQQHSGYR